MTVVEGCSRGRKIGNAYLHAQWEALSGKAWELSVGNCLCGGVVFTAKVRPQIPAMESKSQMMSLTQRFLNPDIRELSLGKCNCTMLSGLQGNKVHIILSP